LEIDFDRQPIERVGARIRRRLPFLPLSSEPWIHRPRRLGGRRGGFVARLIRLLLASASREEHTTDQDRDGRAQHRVRETVLDRVCEAGASTSVTATANTVVGIVNTAGLRRIDAMPRAMPRRSP
jgi:hypothetical protein